MAATLKMCLMVHVEDSETWGPDNTKGTSLGSLAGAVGALGAKVSVQFGRTFLDTPGGYPLGGSTNLRTVLYHGGNFWTHTHSAALTNLRSNYSCVLSAYHNEGGPTNYPDGGPGGRSGGWSPDGTDWVDVTLAAGIRVMNSAAMGAHALVPSSARPYGISDDEIEKLYPKGQAPGPIHTDVMTMRQRPFWMDVASNWFVRTNTIYPSATDTGSVMMIPAPGKLDLPGLAEGRTAFNVEQFTDADLKAALTQAWTAYSNITYQQSITNVWYTHIPFRNIHQNPTAISMVTTFVHSMNSVFGVGGGAPLAEWKNMNQIASLFANPSSFNF